MHGAKKILLQNDILELEQDLARNNLVDFLKYKFKYHHLKPFYPNWHHDCIAEHLDATNKKQLLRLIITMPPSYGKTEEVVRGHVSYSLGHVPTRKFIYTSYGGDLTDETSSGTRDWMQSSAYRGIFKDVTVSKKAEQKTAWKTEQGGGLYATTIGGAITGFHANEAIIIDDPLKANDAYSKSEREKVIKYYTGSLLSRLEEWGDEKVAIIIIMQRLHPNDLVGHLLKEQGNLYTHLNLPALVDKRTIYKFGNFEYIREANEPLFHAKHSYERLKELEEIEMGMVDYKTQMLQDPEVSKAGFFQEEWFREVGLAELPEQSLYIIVDSAMSIKERGIVVPGWCKVDAIEYVTLMDAFYGKWLFDDFLEHIIEAMILYPDAEVWIEAAGGGIIVGQEELPKRIAKHNTKRRSEGKSLIKNRINMYTPSNKVPRVQKIATTQAYAQNGQVRIRRGANGKDKFISEYLAFNPDKENNKDDLIDPFSESFNFATAKKVKTKKADDNFRQRNNRGWSV